MKKIFNSQKSAANSLSSYLFLSMCTGMIPTSY